MAELGELVLVRAALEEERQALERQGHESLTEIERASEVCDEDRASSALQRLLEAARLKKRVLKLQSQLDEEETQAAHAVGSWFLTECFGYLVRKDPEDMVYVTGIQAQGLLTLERMVTFRLKEQTVVHVAGDVRSSHQALVTMDEVYGHYLHGWFHSHPGNGANATHPSGTDRDHQERLERGGYPAIGAIFARDGFVRFFSLKRPFEIMVYGKGVERIDDNLYRLTQIGQVHHSTHSDDG